MTKNHTCQAFKTICSGEKSYSLLRENLVMPLVQTGGKELDGWASFKI
jgi:hypothetical protein